MNKSILLLAVVVLMLSCSKDEEKDVLSLEIFGADLYYNDTHQIEAKSKSAITYTSENEYHATVSKDGLVKARHIGQTDILLTNSVESKKYTIVVTPKHFVYPEPPISFGMSKDAIIGVHGKPDFETDEGFFYDNYSANAPSLIFLFDNNNRVIFYAVRVNPYMATPLANFIGERYAAIGMKDGSFIFANGFSDETITLGVIISVPSSSYVQVMYMPFSPLKSSTRFDNSRIDTIMKQFK